MRTIELLIDEEIDYLGVNAISLVETPAIEEKFIALSKTKEVEVELAKVDEERRILMGAALIPDKKILRLDEEGYFEVYFSKETINQASQLFLKNGYQGNSTLEHEVQLTGLSVVESWIIEDETHDKSRAFGLNHPVGTWMLSMKVDNDEVWYDYVKTGKVKGFSIESMFASKVDLTAVKDEYKADLKSFSNYPESVKNNAKRALKWAEENGWGSCGTGVGKQRANQLASGEAISLKTVKRMYSYLSRHAPDLNSSKSYEDGCGKLMYDAWGGKSALSWSKGVVNRETNMSQEDQTLNVLETIKDLVSNKLKELE